MIYMGNDREIANMAEISQRAYTLLAAGQKIKAEFTLFSDTTLSAKRIGLKSLLLDRNTFIQGDTAPDEPDCLRLINRHRFRYTFKITD